MKRLRKEVKLFFGGVAIVSILIMLTSSLITSSHNAYNKCVNGGQSENVCIDLYK